MASEGEPIKNVRSDAEDDEELQPQKPVKKKAAFKQFLNTKMEKIQALFKSREERKRNEEKTKKRKEKQKLTMSLSEPPKKKAYRVKRSLSAAQRRPFERMLNIPQEEVGIRSEGQTRRDTRGRPLMAPGEVERLPQGLEQWSTSSEECKDQGKSWRQNFRPSTPFEFDAPGGFFQSSSSEEFEGQG